MSDVLQLAEAQGLFGDLPLLGWTTDEALCLTSVHDQAFARYPEYAPGVVGNALQDWLQIENPEAEVLQAHRAALQGKVTQFNTQFAGEQFIGWVRFQPKTAGVSRGTLALAVSCGHLSDASDEDSSDLTVHASPAVQPLPWQQIVEAAVDFVLILDEESRILDVNRAAKAIAKPRALGRKLIDVLPRNSRSMFKSAVERVVETGLTEVVEFEIPGRGAQSTWFAARIARLRKADNGYSLALAATDITRRKHTEQKLTAEEAVLRRLLHVQDRERRLIAYDIHDGFVQEVVGAQMMLSAALETLDDDSVKSRERLQRSRELLGRAINEGRRLISELRPMVIDELGIVEGINYLINEEDARGKMKVSLTDRTRFQRLEPLLEGTIFRIIQEALNNARRHGQASRVDIRLTQVDDGNLVLEIQDDGCGFHQEDVPEDRFGLEGMRERARAFGGGTSIESEPGKGTRISVKLPLALPG